jgi:hypothetical protein
VAAPVRAAARPWLFSFAGGPRKGNGTIHADIIQQHNNKHTLGKKAP